MSVHEPSRDDTSDAAWDEIERLLENLADRADSAETLVVFLDEALHGVQELLGGPGGAVWLCDAAGNLQLTAHFGLQHLELHRPECERAHVQLVESTLRRNRARVVPREVADDTVAAPQWPLAIAPLKDGERLVGVLEILLRADARPSSFSGIEQLVAALGDLIVARHRGTYVADLERGNAELRAGNQFAQRVHGSLSLDATAYAIANEARGVLDCDRVSVVSCDSSGARVRAMSGVEQIQQRAELIEKMRPLAEAVAQSGETLTHPDRETLPPQLELLIDAYVDVSECRWLHLVPLSAARSEEQDAACLGVLIAENFDGGRAVPSAALVSTIAAHSSPALQVALEFQQLPFSGLLRPLASLGWVRRWRDWPLAARCLAVALLMLAGLAFIPAPFRIEADGWIYPQISHRIYAPSDAEVAELHVEHHQQVAAGKPLIALSSVEIDLEEARVAAQRLVTLERIRSLDLARLNDDEPRRDGAPPNTMAAQRSELLELLASTERQAEILARQRQALEVTSPIDGQVLAWDVEQRLGARPVKRGQLLMEVVDAGGPWVLTLEVPDHQIGHVLAFQERSSGPLGVRLILGTDPQQPLAGEIIDIARTTSLDRNDRPCVRVQVLVEGRREAFRPGATAIGKIDCGYQPLGYVWLHDLWDTVRLRLLF